MLYAVMLILREVLEASLFLSLLLALGDRLTLSRIWLMPALCLGLIASIVASQNAAWIAEQFDGAGQELLNASLFLVAMIAFTAINAFLVPRIIRTQHAERLHWLGIAFGAIVICSLAREGSEVWIYLSSFQAQPGALRSAAIGGMIGAGIGLSLGALVYFLFAALPNRTFLPVFVALTSLVVCGMAMQIAKLGMQIGWLESGDALWDISAILSEQSWFGLFMHALFGYDANPDAVQVVFYGSAVIVMTLACLTRYLFLRRRSNA